LTVLVDALGWVGMVLLLGAYWLLTAGRLRASGVRYQLANLLGGCLLMVNTAYHGAWPSAALNLVWFGIGAIGIRQGILAHRGRAAATVAAADRALRPDSADR
jgi:hypothetical protein